MPSAALHSIQVDGRPAPVAIATPRPRFSWIHDSQVVRQDAYEVEVVATGSREPVAQTGRVDSTESAYVDVLETDLAPDTDYQWRVRVWTDGRGTPSEWATSRFGTSLFQPADWRAGRWIEPAQEPVIKEESSGFTQEVLVQQTPPETRLHPALFTRQTVKIPGQVARARLFMTARGVYVPRVNGQAISTETLAPGYDAYQRMHSFQAYDVTQFLSSGTNVIGAILGDGWWAGRISFVGASANYGDRLQLLWELRVTLADGTELTYGSDTTARSSTGPIRYADIFIGERHDHRLAIPGWDTGAFDDKDWTPVADRGEPNPELVPFAGDPVRCLEEIRPAAILITPAGETVIDLGQNIAGRMRLTARGEAGTQITLDHFEVLDERGNIFVNITGTNKDQTDVVVLAGTGNDETFEPLLTYHGFRYVRVTGYPGTLGLEDASAIVIGTDSPRAGHFTTSDARLNRLHENVVWSHRANFLSIPTDCPQRERAGWTGDAQVFAPAATNNFDVLSFYRHYLDNIRAEQLPDGQVPLIVPYTPSFAATIRASAESDPSAHSSTGWADAIAIIPWVMYERYGDTRVLEENFDAMLAWHAYAQHQAETGRPEGTDVTSEQEERQRYLFNTGNHLGDWLAPSTLEGEDSVAAMMNAPRLTGAIMATLFYAHTTATIARAARVLGHDDEADRLEALFAIIADAFMTEYVGTDGHISSDLQGVYVVALAFGVPPENRREQVASRLVDLIRANGTRLDTGFLSIPHLLDALDQNGHTNLALDLLWQKEQPSWLFEVDHGATTVWESWTALSAEGRPQHVSFNHYAFGVVDDWLYRRLAGIGAAEPGYKQAVIEPVFDARLEYVAAHIDTPYGPLTSQWRRQDDGSHALDVEVPPNTTATVVLPNAFGETTRTTAAPGRHHFLAAPTRPLQRAI